MQAAQLPGTVFVLLIALAAFMNKDPDVVFILALAVGCGWVHYVVGSPINIAAWWLCVLGCALAAMLLLTRIFL